VFLLVPAPLSAARPPSPAPTSTVPGSRCPRPRPTAPGRPLGRPMGAGVARAPAVRLVAVEEGVHARVSHRSERAASNDGASWGAFANAGRPGAWLQLNPADGRDRRLSGEPV